MVSTQGTLIPLSKELTDVLCVVRSTLKCDHVSRDTRDKSRDRVTREEPWEVAPRDITTTGSGRWGMLVEELGSDPDLGI